MVLFFGPTKLLPTAVAPPRCTLPCLTRGVLDRLRSGIEAADQAHPHGGGPPPPVAVVGSSEPSGELYAVAEEVGRRLAEAGAVVVCGGLGGVMEAACRGAKAAGGRTVGILPGTDRRAANPYVDVAIPTGLGEARNALVARAGEVMIAIGGGYGTLAEVALALRAVTPVIGLDTWELAREERPVEAIERVGSATEAVTRALELAGRRG
jgi:uncharacterized protein (TIGR00725 family)